MSVWILLSKINFDPSQSVILLQIIYNSNWTLLTSKLALCKELVYQRFTNLKYQGATSKIQASGCMNIRHLQTKSSCPSEWVTRICTPLWHIVTNIHLNICTGNWFSNNKQWMISATDKYKISKIRLVYFAVLKLEGTFTYLSPFLQLIK